MHPAAVKRYELITKLNEVTNNYFYYIFLFNNPQSPSENYRKFPNYLIEKWIFEISYGNIESDELLAKQWRDFCSDYQYFYGIYQQEEIEKQQQYYYAQLQAQQTQPISFDGASPEHYDPGYNPQHQPPPPEQYQSNEQRVRGGVLHYHEYNPPPAGGFKPAIPEGQNQNQNQNTHHPHKRTYKGGESKALHNTPYDPTTRRKGRDYYERKREGENYLEILQTETRSEPGPTKPVRVQEPVIPEPEPKPVKKPDPPKPQPKPVKLSIEQIKEFINSVSKEELEGAANPEVVSKAKEINAWEMKEEEIAPKEDTFRLGRKESKKPHNNNYDSKNPDFKFGVYKTEEAKAKELGYKGNTSGMVDIKLGANETVEARKLKEEIRQKGENNWTKETEKAAMNLDDLEKSRKEIVFNLNLIVPENLKDV